MADRATIMVVDDVPENVRLLEAVLVPRGYDVTTAGSGEEAIEKVGADPPNLILLDLMMPGMDGHEVCRRLRSEPASQFLPIVMVTASGAQEKVRALETGADDFITKPFDQAELLARVRSLLRIQRIPRRRSRLRPRSSSAGTTRSSTRVAEQVAEIERVGRLKRFLSPQVERGDPRQPEAAREPSLRDHGRVLRTSAASPRSRSRSSREDVHAVLREYHAELGELIFDATTGRSSASRATG